MNGKRIGGVLVVLFLVVCALAWINGGEEPVHPIEQTVALPEGVR